LPEGTQCLPGGYVLEAGNSNVRERQKQAKHQEEPNNDHLERDGAALIRNERSPAAHKPISTGARTVVMTFIPT
jgi:hypothetical protein